MAITNAQLAQQVSELMDYWRTRDLQFAEWLSGSPTGGPYGDGRYPLSDYLGVIQYLFCPAALESGVTSSASSAALSAALAGASKDEALLAQAAAEAAKNQALTHRDDARAARDLAILYRDESANNLAITDTYRTKARAWASNAVDVVVESGLYSALHYATKASETYTNIEAYLTGAVEGAVEAATYAANQSASAAAQSASNAEVSESNAEAARDIALGYKTDAAASAVDAAASALAAQTWNPTLYARLGINNTFTSAKQTYGRDGTNGYLELNQGSAANPGYINFMDVSGSRRGYIGWVSNGRIGIQSESWGFDFAGPILPTINGKEIIYTGTATKIQATGWDGAYVVGHGVSIGVTSGASYIHSYNSTTNTYPKLYLAAGVVELTANTNLSANGKDTIQTSDSWLRLNQSGHYTSGVHTPGVLNVGSTILTTGGDVQASGGFRWFGDTNFYIYNTSGFNYGSWRIGGARNGYIGLMLDDSRQSTFMSNGTSTGVYMQGSGRWSFYDDGSWFRIDRPALSSGSTGYLYYGDTFSNARVFVRNGGSPVGSQEGDITLIW
jgi:hypothetical protein